MQCKNVDLTSNFRNEKKKKNLIEFCMNISTQFFYLDIADLWCDLQQQIRFLHSYSKLAFVSNCLLSYVWICITSDGNSDNQS